jgi:DNA-binding NtrC family response regulator
VARRILVIDDEPDVLQSLRDLLGLLPDCEIVAAPNFKEGLAQGSLGGWDIVLTDQRLPDGRGVDILAEVAKLHPGTTLLLMSAFQDFDMMIRGVNAAHIDYFIQKPWEPADVLKRIEQMLQDRASGGGAVKKPRMFRRIGTPAPDAMHRI